MKQVEDLFNEAILHWRDAKGVGTALIPKSLNDKLLVLGVLQRVLARSPTKSVAIITNTYNERLDLIDFITTQEDEENNKEFKHFIAIKVLKIVTSNLVDSIGGMITPPNLVILYHIDDFNEAFERVLTRIKFNLVIAKVSKETVKGFVSFKTQDGEEERTTNVTNKEVPYTQNNNLNFGDTSSSQSLQSNNHAYHEQPAEVVSNKETKQEIDLTKDSEFPLFKELFHKVAGGSATPDEVMGFLRMQEKFGPASNYDL